jgi:anthranilate synthase/aminodeoxychorismate synthase-like glutamine amidotransferase
MLGEKVKVVRNDQITVEKLGSRRPKAIVISPGPGKPEEAGICLEVIEKLSKDIPTLGICLGHQSIAQAFGGKVISAKRLMHGKISFISHQSKGIFRGLKNPLKVTRYHSLVVERDSLPTSLEITAETDDGTVMAIRHKKFPIEGIQFHPESYMTSEGLKMIENFCKRINRGEK